MIASKLRIRLTLVDSLFEMSKSIIVWLFSNTKKRLLNAFEFALMLERFKYINSDAESVILFIIFLNSILVVYDSLSWESSDSVFEDTGSSDEHSDEDRVFEDKHCSTQIDFSELDDEIDSKSVKFLFIDLAYYNILCHLVSYFSLFY